MTARPWLKWYPADWRADPKLRACDPISRYVWLEMLGLMHEAEPYGHLVSAGRAMDYKTLSRLIGVDVGEVKRAVKELEDRGVFSRTDAGVIFSRRMTRDEQRRKTLADNGRQGGNPILINQRGRGVVDNQGPNQPDKPQKPEARGQKPEDEEEKEKPPSSKVEDLASAREARARGAYAFEGKVLRLNQSDFDTWQRRFHGVADIAAALTPLDEGMAREQPPPKARDAFFRASAYLDKKHQEAMREKQQQPVDIAKRYRNEGMFG